jgi:hypothetical protein
LLIGASFVGAWIQTGAWAFLGPAFVFTLFGLYWSFDMFGSSEPARAAAAVEPSVAPVVVREAEPAAAPVAIRTFEPAAEYVAFESEPVVEEQAALAEFVPEPVVEAKPKRRPKKAKPEPVAMVAEPDPESIAEPVVEQAPVVFDETPSVGEEEQHEPHIEPLFDPQPFARQARPAFGKRPRGPGPRPLPA